MKNVLVVTCGFGEYQRHVENQIWYNQKSNIYNIEFYKLTPDNSDERKLSMHPRLRGKIPKMLIWEEKPNYDYYIWVDAMYHLMDENAIENLVNECINFDACFFHHTLRSSVLDEVKEMEMLVESKIHNGYFSNRYEGEPLVKQYESYAKDTTWNDNFLLECGIFIFSNKVVKNKEYNIMKEWFYHNCIWSIQDQISLPYLIHKFKLNYKILDGSVWKNKYFVRF